MLLKRILKLTPLSNYMFCDNMAVNECMFLRVRLFAVYH